MLQAQRYELILQYLRERGSLSMNELMDRLGVSRETVRRDLTEMHQAGLLTKVHGGAVLRKVADEPPYASRSVLNQEEKKNIARVAVDLVEPGDTIFIDNGTTALEFANAIVFDERTTVLTHSLPVAIALVERGMKVYLTGGLLRPGELSLSGAIAGGVADNFFVDKAFVGAAGICAEHGVTDFHVEESELRRKVLHQAGKRIVLADHSKVGVTAFVSVIPADDVDVLVTDSAADKDLLNGLAQVGMQIIIAE